jgi:hypothetical protein
MKKFYVWRQREMGSCMYNYINTCHSLCRKGRELKVGFARQTYSINWRQIYLFSSQTPSVKTSLFLIKEKENGND